MNTITAPSPPPPHTHLVRSLTSLTQFPVSPSNCQNKGEKEYNQKKKKIAFLKASIKIQEHSDFYQYFQHNAPRAPKRIFLILLSRFNWCLVFREQEQNMLQRPLTFKLISQATHTYSAGGGGSYLMFSVTCCQSFSLSVTQ